LVVLLKPTSFAGWAFFVIINVMMKKGGFFKRTVRDVPLRGKTVLVRADFNVPLNDKGEIADDFRIRASLPTLRYLIERDCKIVICSHLGRPDGQADERYTLEPVAERLTKLLKHRVQFVPECIGDGVHQSAKRLHGGQVMLLENVRFHGGEEANDVHFAEALAKDSAADYFVQDGFGVVHRAHASTSAITQFLPSVAGLLLEKEYTTIRAALDDPKKPLVAVLGGAKISDKIAVIEKFVAIADTIVIGGAMANTFLKQRGYKIGKSIHEDGLDSIVKKIYEAAEKKVGTGAIDDFIVLPTDAVVAKKIDRSERRVVVSVDDVADDELILDIGPDSIATATKIIEGAKTVIWNGTVGYAELRQFSHGSARIALALASHHDITSVIGGGDTADFVLRWDAAVGASFSHVSTGGGACLDLMAGAAMPGIEALLDA
jgi:phosphoglycerate kinase